MKVLFFLVALPELKTQIAEQYGFTYPVMAPPSTLLVLGEIARQSGHQVRLEDSRFHMRNQGDNKWTLDIDSVEACIKSSDADTVGISFLSSSAADAWTIAEISRRHARVVIGGGLHASVAPGDFLENGNFHYIFQGEAEDALPLLLNRIENEGTPPKQAQIIGAPLVMDLARVPPVRDFDIYTKVLRNISRNRSIYIELSRGCIKSCTFCEVARTGMAFRKARKIPLNVAFQTLSNAVQNHGVDYVLVADSIATLYDDHFISFIRKVKSEFANINVQFNSTVDRWNAQIARECQDLRCSVWFGLESGSQRILNVLKKGTTVEQAKEAAKICDDYGIDYAVNVLLGLPGEEECDYVHTMDILQRCRRAHPNPNIFNPLPGTELYAYCYKNGLLRNPKDYTVWGGGRIISQDYEGPVIGVDYRLVLRYQREMINLGKGRNSFNSMR